MPQVRTTPANPGTSHTQSPQQDRARFVAGVHKSPPSPPIDMGEQWHYTRGDKQAGPVSWTDLMHLAASRQLSPADMVWKEGMPNWLPAEKVKNLFAPQSARMPPAPVGQDSASPQR